MWLNKKQLLANKKYLPFFLLAISLLTSSWFYWGSDFKTEQILTSREWQSNSVTRIEAEIDNVGPLKRSDMTSNVVYLPNKTYSKVTVLSLYSETTKELPMNIHISESGTWDVSGGYLLSNPIEFKDITSNMNQDFTKAQLNIIKRVYKMDAQQSRRIDVINDKTLLLTSLNHGSSVLFSH